MKCAWEGCDEEIGDTWEALWSESGSLRYRDEDKHFAHTHLSLEERQAMTAASKASSKNTRREREQELADAVIAVRQNPDDEKLQGKAHDLMLAEAARAIVQGKSGASAYNTIASVLGEAFAKAPKKPKVGSECPTCGQVVGDTVKVYLSAEAAFELERLRKREYSNGT